MIKKQSHVCSLKMAPWELGKKRNRTEHPVMKYFEEDVDNKSIMICHVKLDGPAGDIETASESAEGICGNKIRISASGSKDLGTCNYSAPVTVLCNINCRVSVLTHYVPVQLFCPQIRPNSLM